MEQELHQRQNLQVYFPDAITATHMIVSINDMQCDWMR